MRTLALAATCCATLTGHAWAHAFLRSAVPGVGSTVQTAPAQVAITFTEAVEPAFSTIVVTDASGSRVDSGGVHPGGPATLAIGLKTLPPGRYTVTWHATSVDTHKTQGTYSFTVAP
jgi:methionine-rich copper-binding protein CopC